MLAGVDAESNQAETVVRIVNQAGLHARPVMAFVDLANTYQASLCVSKGECRVDGKSPMEMMLLEAPQGTELHLVATGADAQDLVADLAKLVAGGFGEP
ncbi:MAG: HPr family phosphocarrier protein [Phycisphaerae bacterium]